MTGVKMVVRLELVNSLEILKGTKGMQKREEDWVVVLVAIEI